MAFSNARYTQRGGAPSAIAVEIAGSGGAVSFVPIDERNKDYREIMAAANAGKLVIEDAAPEPVPEKKRDLAAEIDALKARLAKVEGG